MTSMLSLLPMSETTIAGQVIYRACEYGIDFERAGGPITTERGTCSLLLATLQIDVDVATGALLTPWGLLPHAIWKSGKLQEIRYPERHGLRVQGQKLDPGVAIGIGALADWSTQFDDERQEVEARLSGEAADHFVEFAAGCILGLREDRPVAIRLRPTFEW